MSSPQLASYDECTGCMACADACFSTCAISIQLLNDGHYYPIVDTDKCMECKLCEKVCPIISNLEYQRSEKAAFYAAWNNDKEQRKKSASGGAFSAIASKVLDEGGIVFGASITNIGDVKHIKITDRKDLFLLQGSKYTHSFTKGCYRDVYECLKKGETVLFSGTACQVAGLYGYLGKRTYCGILITIDLICGGIPSKHLINKFIENEPYKIKRILSFRTKDTGWKPKGYRYNLKVEDTEGTIHDYTGIKTLIIDGFSSELTNRYSCYHCKFAGKRRMSDFTIGDLWGDKQYKEQHYDGLSLIIVHNEKADLLLHQSTQYITIADYNEKLALQSNYRIESTKSYRYIMPERKYMEWIFSHCNYKTLKRIYANDYNYTSPWFLYKVIRKGFEKIMRLQ